jgi:hypothetical protein
MDDAGVARDLGHDDHALTATRWIVRQQVVEILDCSSLV